MKNKRKALHARGLTFFQAELPLLLVSHSEEQVGTSVMQWHIEKRHCHFGSHVPSVFQYEGFSSSCDVCFSRRGKKMMSRNSFGTFKRVSIIIGELFVYLSSHPRGIFMEFKSFDSKMANECISSILWPSLVMLNKQSHWWCIKLFKTFSAGDKMENFSTSEKFH